MEERIVRQIREAVGVEKTTSLPDFETLRKRLSQGASVYGAFPLFYDAFLKRVAGREIQANEINLAWELTMYDKLAGYPRAFKAAINFSFGGVVETIVEDKEVARQVKLMREIILGLPNASTGPQSL